MLCFGCDWPASYIQMGRFLLRIQLFWSLSINGFQTMPNNSLRLELPAEIQNFLYFYFHVQKFLSRNKGYTIYVHKNFEFFINWVANRRKTCGKNLNESIYRCSTINAYELDGTDEIPQGGEVGFVTLPRIPKSNMADRPTSRFLFYRIRLFQYLKGWK